MNVLVVNAGSSSMKYQLINCRTGDVLAKGLCERIGIDGRIEHKMPDRSPYTVNREIKTHAQAVRFLFDILTDSVDGCISDRK